MSLEDQYNDSKSLRLEFGHFMGEKYLPATVKDLLYTRAQAQLNIPSPSRGG